MPEVTRPMTLEEEILSIAERYRNGAGTEDFDPRVKALVITKLEEAALWTTKLFRR